MRCAVDPRQTDMFDPAGLMFSPMTLKVLRGDWPGLFRAQMLHLMPAGKLAEHFHPTLGCPTKELYGMAGVIFLKEFFNLTIEETVRRYLTDTAWQYALNVNPLEASLSHATIARYTKLFVDNDLAADVFHRVTSAIIEAEEQVQLRDKPGGGVMQNPSDPDAGYDGHKAPGHQVQLAETCAEGNDVQLITGVIPEPADRPDSEAVEPMLDQLDAHDRTPEILYADTHYGSDENVTLAAERGVDLQSPVSGTCTHDPDALTVDDLVIAEATETVERCPNGCEPASSVHDAAKGVTTTVMRPSDCHGCDFASQCPARNVHGRMVLRHTAKQRRFAARRAEQATEAFWDHYATRGGGESVNRGLKRKMGMGRLRVRGSPRVRMAVLLRCGGWNFLRALRALRKRGIGDFVALFGRFRRTVTAPWGRECPTGLRRASPQRSVPDSSVFLIHLPPELCYSEGGAFFGPWPLSDTVSAW